MQSICWSAGKKFLLSAMSDFAVSIQGPGSLGAVQLRQREEGSAPEDLLVKIFATYQLAPVSELQAIFLKIADKSSRIDACGISGFLQLLEDTQLGYHEAFSFQAEQSHFSQPFFIGEVLHPSSHLDVPPLDSLQQVPVLPELRTPELDAVSSEQNSNEQELKNVIEEIPYVSRPLRFTEQIWHSQRLLPSSCSSLCDQGELEGSTGIVQHLSSPSGLGNMGNMLYPQEFVTHDARVLIALFIAQDQKYYSSFPNRRES
ncbi:hypothetical protein DUI87_16910 [Hirundo rustica rustica]|uniref:Uncharacterized protein n=1 Tax=Hirundo rustica rustica TaxID=333673 RepID=A0A3M0K4P9_HIRRU|nr:hypothetical protein DUI87_16910 [Hirundo rustica rustica]